MSDSCRVGFLASLLGFDGWEDFGGRERERERERENKYGLMNRCGNQTSLKKVSWQSTLMCQPKSECKEQDTSRTGLVSNDLQVADCW